MIAEPNPAHRKLVCEPGYLALPSDGLIERHGNGRKVGAEKMWFIKLALHVHLDTAGEHLVQVALVPAES